MASREFDRRVVEPGGPDSSPAAAPPRLGRAIKWRNLRVFLSSNLAGDYVGLTETEGDLITITYGPLALGELDLQLRRFSPRVRWVG